MIATASPLMRTDPDLAHAIQAEAERQRTTIELIASENFVSRAVLEAVGSVMTNKYAEGYPGKRYYGGCEYVDVAEDLAIERAKALFGADHVNVQPHSGSNANLAVYMAFLKPGDRILGMSLQEGGHLTHGLKVNFSGTLYESHSYGVDHETGLIDYEEVQRRAEEVRPQAIIAGASAYSRTIDFERFRAIADAVDALLFADIAHPAGLVAAGLHPTPIGFAHVTMTTTHKTLRGPRGGMILTSEAHGRQIDKMVLPGLQGGPLMHVIAGKAVAFGEALRPDFTDYAERIIQNARAMASTIQDRGLRVVSGGTDNHMFLVDVGSIGVTGKQAESALEEAGITVNKNTIPGDTRKPTVGSGIRIGTPAVTTRGFTVDDCRETANLIADVLESTEDPDALKQVRERARALAERFPLPGVDPILA